MSRLRKPAAAVFAVIALAGLMAAATAAAARPAWAGSITARGPSAGADELGNQYVFWRGTGGQLEEAWYSQYTRQWSGPIDLNMGTLGSEPSVAISTANAPCDSGQNACGLQYVYWEGTGPGYDLWMAYWDKSGWHGPINLGMGPLGSQPAASYNDPAVLSPQGQELDVYWKGTDGNLWYAYSDSGYTTPGGYSGPHAAYHNGHGLGVLGSSPSASTAVGQNGADYDYLTWQGTDGALWNAEFGLYNHAWLTGATKNTCCGTLGGPPSVAAEAASSASYDVVWQGDGGSYNLWWWFNGRSSPIDLGMGTLGSAPTIAFSGDAANYHLYVFWKGSSDASLYEAYFDGPNGPWHGPIDLGMGPLG